MMSCASHEAVASVSPSLQLFTVFNWISRSRERLPWCPVKPYPFSGPSESIAARHQWFWDCACAGNETKQFGSDLSPTQTNRAEHKQKCRKTCTHTHTELQMYTQTPAQTNKHASVLCCPDFTSTSNAIKLPSALIYTFSSFHWF